MRVDNLVFSATTQTSDTGDNTASTQSGFATGLECVANSPANPLLPAASGRLSRTDQSTQTGVSNFNTGLSSVQGSSASSGKVTPVRPEASGAQSHADTYTSDIKHYQNSVDRFSEATNKVGVLLPEYEKNRRQLIAEIKSNVMDPDLRQGLIKNAMSLKPDDKYFMADIKEKIASFEQAFATPDTSPAEFDAAKENLINHFSIDNVGENMHAYARANLDRVTRIPVEPEWQRQVRVYAEASERYQSCLDQFSKATDKVGVLLPEYEDKRRQLIADIESNVTDPAHRQSFITIAKRITPDIKYFMADIKEKIASFEQAFATPDTSPAEFDAAKENLINHFSIDNVGKDMHAYARANLDRVTPPSRPAEAPNRPATDATTQAVNSAIRSGSPSTEPVQQGAAKAVTTSAASQTIVTLLRRTSDTRPQADSMRTLAVTTTQKEIREMSSAHTGPNQVEDTKKASRLLLRFIKTAFNASKTTFDNAYLTLHQTLSKDIDDIAVLNHAIAILKRIKNNFYLGNFSR